MEIIPAAATMDGGPAPFVFLEGGKGSYVLGAWYEPADSLVVAAKYAYAGGRTYTWYGWDYIAKVHLRITSPISRSSKKQWN